MGEIEPKLTRFSFMGYDEIALRYFIKVAKEGRYENLIEDNSNLRKENDALIAALVRISDGDKLPRIIATLAIDAARGKA